MGGCHLNAARELDTAQFRYLHAGEKRFSPLAPHLAAALTEGTNTSHQRNIPLLISNSCVSTQAYLLH